MINVLMVCLGNICRSPMAEAVMRARVAEAGLEDRIRVASAGTGSWHLGERPHASTLAELRRRGLDLAGKRAQHVSEFDLGNYDYVIAMDRANHGALGGAARLLLEFAPGEDVDEVPDPYYVGGFDRVYDLVDAGCRGLLQQIVADLHGIDGDDGPNRRSGR